MSDYKLIELFTALRLVDLAGAFDPETVDVVDVVPPRVEARLAGEGNRVMIVGSHEVMPTHSRIPFVLVRIDHELSRSSPEELARSCAELAVHYVQQREWRVASWPISTSAASWPGSRGSR